MNGTRATVPVAEKERAQVLDALRGFALFGILVSHVPGFSGWTYMVAAEQFALDRFGIDATLATIQEFLIRGKFYSLFALLFGIGFAIQLDSAVRRGTNFARRFARRLTVLLAIGLLHAGLWYGDILKDYALIGFLLILTARLHVRTVAWILLAVLALRLAWPWIMAIIAPLVMTGGTEADPVGSFSALTRAFGSADPLAVMSANAQLLKLKALQMIYEGKAISVLMMFLLGTLVGRLRLYRDLRDHRRLYIQVLIVCVPVGLIGNAFLVPLHAASGTFPPSAIWIAERTLFAIAVPALALAYAAGFALLWARGKTGLLRLFAPAGRMALTTYVCQSLILIALFYGIGLGWRGGIGLAEGTTLAIVIFAVQSLAAAGWLRVYRFGPLEWVWRRLTYGTPIPNLRPVQA